ncbi:hypothetical protein LTR95_017731, partial [Oleoguttula sp. CCFEE 5521]
MSAALAEEVADAAALLADPAALDAALEAEDTAEDAPDVAEAAALLADPLAIEVIDIMPLLPDEAEEDPSPPSARAETLALPQTMER